MSIECTLVCKEWKSDQLDHVFQIMPRVGDYISIGESFPVKGGHRFIGYYRIENVNHVLNDTIKGEQIFLRLKRKA